MIEAVSGGNLGLVSESDPFGSYCGTGSGTSPVRHSATSMSSAQQDGKSKYLRGLSMGENEMDEDA